LIVTACAPYKLEAGKHAAKPQDIPVLCGRYGAAAEEIPTLQALALATQEASWWHVYGDDAVPEWFSLYMELEPTASSIQTYEAELVPGLLQTEDYARAIYRAFQPAAQDGEIERRVAVRMERQAMVDPAQSRLQTARTATARSSASRTPNGTTSRRAPRAARPTRRCPSPTTACA
jgi:hypothetical protein